MIRYLGYILTPLAAFSLGTVLVTGRDIAASRGADEQANHSTPIIQIEQDPLTPASTVEILDPAPLRSTQDEPLPAQASLSEPALSPVPHKGETSSVTADLPESKEELLAIRQQSARELLTDYLAAWSSPNSEALSSISRFYGSAVRFYGKDISTHALTEEKKRFVQLWPIRHYQVKPGSILAQCDGGTDTCKVVALLEYMAQNPSKGRRAMGAAGLELTIAYSNGRPEIVEESSGRPQVRSMAQASGVRAPASGQVRPNNEMPPIPPPRPDRGNHSDQQEHARR